MGWDGMGWDRMPTMRLATPNTAALVAYYDPDLVLVTMY